MIGINGAAARLVHPGDLVILIGYGQMTTAEASEHEPSVVFVDAENRVVAPAPTRLRRLPGAACSAATSWRTDRHR